MVNIPHMLHVWYITTYIWVILFGQMLVKNPAPWCIWVPLMNHGQQGRCAGAFRCHFPGRRSRRATISAGAPGSLAPKERRSAGGSVAQQKQAYFEGEYGWIPSGSLT